MTAPDIARAIAERLEPLAPVHVALDDQSAAHAGHAGAAGGGGHFSLLVVSEAFTGAGSLARHRRVMDRLSDLFPHPVHALSIRACTPDEYFTSHERTVR
ncbi:MAG: BolA family transcriptional regulator [Burkholderiales bacterium]|nr:BolA family transcriptional regulator [Burkholderiales bacterium]MCE7877249.1 BolA family transcriptional regulator [Betaproteobacteria bacterium PRO3]